MSAIGAAASAAALVVAIPAARRPSPRRLPATSASEAETGGVKPWRASTSVRRIAAVVIACIAAVLVGALPVVAMLVGSVGLRRGRLLLRSRLDTQHRAQAIPDVIELFVMLVHAGLTPRQAVEQLATRAPQAVRPAFCAVVHQLDRGRPLADALPALRTEIGPAASALVDIVGTADRYGLAIAPVLERLAVDGRATRRRLDEAAARALPVKLAFPLVFCTLPSFVLLAIVPAVLAALSSLGDTAW